MMVRSKDEAAAADLTNQLTTIRNMIAQTGILLIVASARNQSNG